MLDVRLARKGAKPGPRIAAVVDTGSPFCLFRADLGRQIGLEIERGIVQEIGGVVAGMGEKAYFQRVNLYVEMDWIVEIHAVLWRTLALLGYWVGGVSSTTS